MLYKYKYQAPALELGYTVDCPSTPISYSGIAYCFIHSDYTHRNNFIPKGIQNPQRIQRVTHKNEVTEAQIIQEKCNLLGLSFYENPDQAKAKYDYFNTHNKKRQGNFAAENGDLLAAVLLTPEDGRRDDCDGCYDAETTHFNFFPFEDIDLFSNIQNTTQLWKIE